MYRMEPVENPHTLPKTLSNWIIELEVGNGIGRNVAVISDLTHSKSTQSPDGKFSVVGVRTLTVPLDRMPTLENAREAADEIALALLRVPGKAKPSDLVLYVCHDGLSRATVNNPPLWQRHFRYMEVSPKTAEVSPCGGR
jgi:hypothetical protein